MRKDYLLGHMTEWLEKFAHNYFEQTFDYNISFRERHDFQQTWTRDDIQQAVEEASNIELNERVYFILDVRMSFENKISTRDLMEFQLDAVDHLNDKLDSLLYEHQSIQVEHQSIQVDVSQQKKVSHDE